MAGREAENPKEKLNHNAIRISERVWKILACPHCSTPLKPSASGADCTKCNASYPVLDNGQLDLRLQKPKSAIVAFELGKRLLPEKGYSFAPLLPHSDSPINLDKLDIPWHLTLELISNFPKARSRDALMLDLGCGEGIHKEIAEAFGYEWVGLDYSIPAAPIKGDAHALPFQNASFEFILSIAVLEHIQFPFVMTQETFRVLKPGSLFIGTVSFLEPFHNDSYYHHSHLATFNSLHNAGFELLHVSPAKNWMALLAIGNMALFRQLPIWLTWLLVLPLQALHRLWWWVGHAITKSKRASEEYRLLSTTGAFTFIARKPT